ncbi:MAG: type II toxin-antitoxin system PemK/MazF family toxin [Burkholderiales bacterium]|nr:type II toxin-antitoxin system PemK/MazF family toxin [Burkholderiales bacterium]
MPNTNGFEFGQIVLVCFPFSDLSSAKQRLAVVVSSSRYNQTRHDLILMAVTSQIRTTTVDKTIITDWQTAGLLKPSVIKPIVFTAEKSIIKKSLGKLGNNDQLTLRATVDSIIG